MSIKKKQLIFSLIFGVFSLTMGADVSFAQCGADGLSPCTAPPAAVKAVVKKVGTLKKNAASAVEKSVPKSSKTSKSSKNSKDDTSIYDSLKISPNKNVNNSSRNELFPLNSVTLGQTTERQLQILGGERKTFTDPQTGDKRVYYNLAKRSFWLYDGVADSVGFFSVQGMPTQWQKLGLNFGMSLNEAADLLKSLGYEVQKFGILQKLEDIGTNKTYAARVTGSKNGETPLLVGMEFTLGNGNNTDSPNTMVYFAVRVKH